MCDGEEIGDLRFHWLGVKEWSHEEVFEKVVGAQLAAALVTSLEQVPNIFGGLCIEDVVVRGAAKGENELKVGLLVTLAPLLIGHSVHVGIGRGGNTIDDVP